MFEALTVVWSGVHKCSKTWSVALIRLENLLLVTTAWVVRRMLERVAGGMSRPKRTARKIAIATYSQWMDVWAVTFHYYDSSQHPADPFIVCPNLDNISSGWTSRRERRGNGRIKWFHFQILPLYRSAREWSWCPPGACAACSSSLWACS